MPRSHILLACLFAAFAACPSWSQPKTIGEKPPESATKVKKVMVYSYLQSWVHVDGIPALEEVIGLLARDKGFDYQIVKDPLLLTPDFLAGFDVLVWNNNTNAYSAVRGASAKQALLDYIRDGGGWVGVHGALDHDGGWKEWGDLIGVSGSRWSGLYGADLVIDPEARSHPEMAHMIADFPTLVPVIVEHKGYDRTVRNIEGIIVGATMQSKQPNRVVANYDGITEQALWWARMHGKGRMFMTDFGHFRSHYALSDSFGVKALWEHLRFAAGDYQNGCTDPASRYFSPEARVDDGSCGNGVPTLSAGRQPFSGSRATVRLEGLQPSEFTLPFTPGKALEMELHDLQGRKAWSRSLRGSDRTHRVAGPEPGMYVLRFRDGARQMTRRVLAVRPE